MSLVAVLHAAFGRDYAVDVHMEVTRTLGFLNNQTEEENHELLESDYGTQLAWRMLCVTSNDFNLLCLSMDARRLDALL